MQIESMYHVACVCGAPIQSLGTDGVCAACNRGFSLEWQAAVAGSTAKPSITGKYEEVR